MAHRLLTSCDLVLAVEEGRAVQAARVVDGRIALPAPGYPDLAPNLAMKIAKRATLEDVGAATWPAFAEDIGLAASFVRRRVSELSAPVIDQLPALPDNPALAAPDASALKRYSALIVSRAERVARTGTKS